jgi:hypothetical protein
MSSARMNRGIAVALAVSLLLVLPAWAHAGVAPARQAPQASSWDGFVEGLRRAAQGGWQDLLAFVAGAAHLKAGAAAPAAESQDTATPTGGTGLYQHPTIDPNG